MVSLPPRQRLLLETLRSRPAGAGLDELAQALGVTRTAAKGHLQKLLDMGFVGFEDAKGTVGRPRRSYLISEAGLEVFPKKYSWLSNIMLAELARDMGPKGVAAFMRRLGEKVAAGLAHELGASSPAERLKQVTRALNELGYQAGLREGPTAKAHIIEAVNCVYHSVAKEHPELCQFDVKFIEKASGMGVQLESCIAKGGSSCRFCVRPLDEKKERP